MSDDPGKTDPTENILPFRTVIRSPSEIRKSIDTDSEKNTPPMRYGGGKMIKYLPKYCDEVIELGKEGKSTTYMIGALGISKDTFYNWRDKFPEFDEAVKMAQLFSQQWWEDLGQAGTITKAIDATLWNRNMAVRFKDEWQEVRRVEATGKDGEAIKVENRVDIVNEILNNLKVIEHDDKN